MNKLPQITLAFGVMKICATTLGETAGDLLSMTLNVGYALSSMILISLSCVTSGRTMSVARCHGQASGFWDTEPAVPRAALVFN